MTTGIVKMDSLCSQFWYTVIAIVSFYLLVCAGDGGGEFCENEVFEASCSDDEVIFMTKSLYGRMAVGRCVTYNYGHIGCHIDVLPVTDSLCSGQRHCQIPVPNSALNRDLEDCPNDLKPYLEVEYTCIKVETAVNQTCRSGDSITPPSPSGYLSNYMAQTRKLGSPSCPWVLKVLPGQQIAVTLFDFHHKSSLRTSGNLAICSVYALISEHGKTARKLCGIGERNKTVYVSSAGNPVRIQMDSRATRHGKRLPYFLLRYEVFGCVDLVAPPNTWTKRRNNTSFVGCPSSGKTWQLTCRNAVWEGHIGNCSKDDHVDKFGAIWWGPIRIPFVLSMIIIGAVGLTLGLCLLVTGLICMRKKHKKPPSRSMEASNRKASQKLLEQNRYQKPPSEASSVTHLPPPPPYLMDVTAVAGSDNDYAFVHNMPLPPPSPSPPTSRRNSAPMIPVAATPRGKRVSKPKASAAATPSPAKCCSRSSTLPAAPPAYCASDYGSLTLSERVGPGYSPKLGFAPTYYELEPHSASGMYSVRHGRVIASPRPGLSHSMHRTNAHLPKSRSTHCTM